VGKIVLNPALTEREFDLMMAWLRHPRGVARADWPDTLRAFDRPRISTVEWAGRTETFSRFYEHFVDEWYSFALSGRNTSPGRT